MSIPFIGLLSGGYLYGCIALAAFGVGGYAMHVWDATTIADLKVEIAANKVAIADYSASVARDTATANETARQQEHDLSFQAEALRRQLSTDEALLSGRSDQAQKDLGNASKDDTSPLGRAVRQYIDGVRRDQSAPALHP